MSQQASTEDTRWTCNLGCAIDFSRLADAERHAEEVHRGAPLHCHVPGCRWSGARRKDRLTKHMNKEHSELMSVLLEIPDDGSWPPAQPVAHDYNQNQGYDHNVQYQQPTSTDASVPATHTDHPPIPLAYPPVPFSSHSDANMYMEGQQSNHLSSQNDSSHGDIGQYYSDPTYNQYSSSVPPDGDVYKDDEVENEEFGAKVVYVQK